MILILEKSFCMGYAMGIGDNSWVRRNMFVPTLYLDTTSSLQTRDPVLKLALPARPMITC